MLDLDAKLAGYTGLMMTSIDKIDANYDETTMLMVYLSCIL